MNRYTRTEDDSKEGEERKTEKTVKQKQNCKKAKSHEMITEDAK